MSLNIISKIRMYWLMNKNYFSILDGLELNDLIRRNGKQSMKGWKRRNRYLSHCS